MNCKSFELLNGPKQVNDLIRLNIFLERSLLTNIEKELVGGEAKAIIKGLAYKVFLGSFKKFGRKQGTKI